MHDLDAAFSKIESAAVDIESAWSELRTGLSAMIEAREATKGEYGGIDRRALEQVAEMFRAADGHSSPYRRLVELGSWASRHGEWLIEQLRRPSREAGKDTLFVPDPFSTGGDTDAS